MYDGDNLKLIIRQCQTKKPILVEHGSVMKEPNCGRTAEMRVYSNAYLSEETGDVGGIELAIKDKRDSSVNALLFVYEGAPNDEAIPLSGSVTNKHLTLQGNWVEHLVEYPSKKEIVQTQFVTSMELLICPPIGAI